MSNTQFGWLIAPQLLMLLAIIGGWAKYRFQRWTSETKVRLHLLRNRSAGPAGNSATWPGAAAGPYRRPKPQELKSPWRPGPKGVVPGSL
jgi:hypothetical protein